ncbi:hypothetical protein MASR1M65_28010 [Saprospiraceae bacterium]
MAKKTALLILDGWGIGSRPAADAILQAHTPFFDMLWSRYPHNTLTTFGEAVGLPDGQMGNSEVGHMNIGAGRVVYQELVRINLAFKNGLMTDNIVLCEAAEYSLTRGTSVHIMGLVSNGGVHSHIDHLVSLVEIMAAKGVKNIYIHAFTDGRDTDPHSGLGFLTEAELKTAGKARIVTVIGRYYAMDRDKRWERIKVAYDALVNAKGEMTDDIFTKVKESYASDTSDEFIRPILLNTKDYEAYHTRIKDGDVVINFNFRTDRPREITTVIDTG